jgi:hypothetical protein
LFTAVILSAEPGESGNFAAAGARHGAFSLSMMKSRMNAIGIGADLHVTVGAAFRDGGTAEIVYVHR